LTEGETYTASLFAKKGTLKKISFKLLSSNESSNGDDGSTPIGFDEAIFDLNDGSISGESTNASMVDYGNGWYRCIVTDSVAEVVTDARMYVYFREDDGTKSYTGTTSQNIEIYGAQVEEGPYATSYIPTHGAAATRTGEGEAVDTFKAQLPTALNGASAYTLFMDLTVTDLEDEVDFRDVIIFRDSTKSASFDSFKLETYTNNGTSSLRGFAYKTASTTAVTNIPHNTIAIGSRCKLAVVFNSASGVKAFYNGSGTPVINYSEATTYESVDLVQGAESSVPGTRSRTRIHAIHGYPSALSDAQCVSLTTL
jgi:hypothetical protein